MSDKENKSKIGYRTTATELQYKFEELSANVERNEKDWSELMSLFDSLKEEAKSKIGSEKNPSIALFPELMRFQHLIEMSMMCVLGESIAKVEGRIVKLEKSIDNLHLKVK